MYVALNGLWGVQVPEAVVEAELEGGERTGAVQGEAQTDTTSKKTRLPDPITHREESPNHFLSGGSYPCSQFKHCALDR